MKTRHSARQWLLRGLFALLSLALLGTTALLGVNGYVKARAAPYLISGEEAAALGPVDSILVLGCGLQEGRPGPMLQDRLDQGLALYRAGVSDRLLMSGDHRRAEHDEVNAMKSYAMAAEVPSQAVFMDHAGFSTYESMYRARDVFAVRRVVIVTQDYHLYRAVYVARALGLEAYGVAAASYDYAGQSYRDLREILARGKDFFYTLLKPEPLLGEVIPVSGDGNLTNDGQTQKQAP